MAATYSSLVGFAIGGKYEVRRVIGAGGMGVVCEAMHLDLGKRVAVKLIDKSMKESESIVARFRREAKAAGRIQSEHIVDVFDVNADPRVGLYMVMEHLSGEDLQARLERDKRLDVKTSVMIAHQVARGLAKAHEAGVIHRDLKPANVFLTQRDNGQLLVKLLDFGVSKLLREEAGDSRITGTGTPIGTPLYMSPEQAEGKDDVDGRADLWSLGAVLYEALAGAPPFADRGSYHATIVGILASRPRLLQDAAPWVPAAIAKVVDAMLVHDRDARIATAGEVTQRLLDAYPAVLPDGTGRHTAVIVPQSQAAFDETGDTEIFASTTPFRVNTPSAPPEDSTKTVPFVDPAERGSGDARSTAAATPIDYAGRASAISAPPHSPPVSSGVTSSSQGVSLPETPPQIEPLPPSELAPETTRDAALALRAERRRRLSKALLLLVVLAVAVGGYAAGRRASTAPVAPAPSNASAPEPPPPAATATATTTTTATATVEPSAEAAPVVPTALPSALPSALTPPKRKAAPPKAVAPKSSSNAGVLTPYDEQPPAPPPPDVPPAY